MTKNPFYNALMAVVYIALVISGVFLGPHFFPDAKDTVFIPIGMLSLLVLSVAVMAYLFFYQPVTMLIDGHREKAVKFFLQTVGTFAGVTVLVFIVAGIFSR